MNLESSIIEMVPFVARSFWPMIVSTDIFLLGGQESKRVYPL